MRSIDYITMKTTKKKIKLIVEKTDTGFSAYSNNYPIFTTGRTIPELINNAYDASCLFFEEEKLAVSHENVKFEIDFSQFFRYYKVINSKFLAERIGMNPTLLSQYVQGHKKPSESQTEKILAGIHQIGLELSEMNLIYHR
ncbi:MAG: helix-turn-helix transcriptional regulator [Bacteroidales bacterium]|nr:helix-turn-helix transcriptional regulator [Bacteroidales bacterium]